MTLTEKIKMLADEKKTTFAEIERHVGISNGQIRRWDNVSPKAENLKKVADYFQVSVDYLLGRTEEKEPLLVATHVDDNLTEQQKKEVQDFIKFIKMRDHNEM